MIFLRSCLYSLGIYVGLVILAILVACIMKIIYSVVHKSEKKAGSGTEIPPAVAGTAGKAG